MERTHGMALGDEFIVRCINNDNLKQSFTLDKCYSGRVIRPINKLRLTLDSDDQGVQFYITNQIGHRFEFTSKSLWGESGVGDPVSDYDRAMGGLQ